MDGAAEDTIVDGLFLPQSQQWDQRAVWWDSHDVAGQYITIDLGAIFSIESFVVQADDNDAYILSYWDLTTSSWELAWDVPNYDFLMSQNLWGMQTRPNPTDNNERYIIPGDNIITNALRLEGNVQDSDRYFSVSEVQAYGNAVAEPTTLLLIGTGLFGLAAFSRRWLRR